MNFLGKKMNTGHFYNKHSSIKPIIKEIKNFGAFFCYKLFSKHFMAPNSRENIYKVVMCPTHAETSTYHFICDYMTNLSLQQTQI